MYWLNESKGVLARCEQLAADGSPVPGQIEVPDDDPRVVARLNPPDPPPPITVEEVLTAVDLGRKGDWSKLDALLARRAR